MQDFKAGDRVTATVYGTKVRGRVTERQAGSGIVWVRWDGAVRDSWMHAGSLTDGSVITIPPDPGRYDSGGEAGPAK